MSFEPIDGYLLDGKPPKRQVIATLLRERRDAPGAAPFYEGLQMLGERAPDLSLIALRLVLAGRRADDAAVVALRDLVARVRAGGDDAAEARAAYEREVGAGPEPGPTAS